MRYYVSSYPNPRAEDGETSGYWQHRSQVFGKPIINPNPEKVDLDGDGIVEARQSSLLADKPELQKPEKPVNTAKNDKKVSFDRTSIDTNGKIALDLVANDIDQLVKDLYDIGVDGIITFGNNASVRISASKIPALEQLPSLAFGRTTQKGVTRKNGKITGIAIPEQPEEERVEVHGTDKRFFDVTEQENVRINLPNTPSNTIGTIGEEKKKKTFEEIKREAKEFVEKATKSLLINPGNTWGGAYMLPGGDSARNLVPGQRPSNFAGNAVSASKEVAKGVSETTKTLTEGTTNKRKKVSGTGVTLSQSTSEERTGTKQNNGYQITTKRERKISYDGINFMPWKEGSPQPIPQQSKSTTIIAKSASFEGQAKLPQGSKRNAFGQPVGLNSYTSRRIGSSAGGGNSNTQQVRMGGSSSGGSSGGGTRVQVSPGGSNSKGSRKSSSSHRRKS